MFVFWRGQSMFYLLKTEVLYSKTLLLPSLLPQYPLECIAGHDGTQHDLGSMSAAIRGQRLGHLQCLASAPSSGMGCVLPSCIQLQITNNFKQNPSYLQTNNHWAAIVFLWKRNCTTITFTQRNKLHMLLHVANYFQVLQVW